MTGTPSTVATAVVESSSHEPAPFGSAVAETIRVILVAGIGYGIVMGGGGARLVMFVLRLTSPDRAVGVTSDDGFTIGRVTLAGTYNLLALGAAVGVIGVGTYLLVAPRLIGPPAFRRATLGVAAGAVVGSSLVRPDSVDFAVLRPTWLAVAVLVALPALFTAFIGDAVRVVADAKGWTAAGRRRWLCPALAVALVPQVAVLVPFVVGGVALCTAIGRSRGIDRLRRHPAFTLTVRAAWLVPVALGLNALVGDVAQLAS